MYHKNIQKNFYLKDKNKSFERLSGEWLWTNTSDTLILQITPRYKEKYDEKVSGYRNAYYDTAIIKVKYTKNGITIYDDLEKDIDKICLKPYTFKILTDFFYLKNLCTKAFSNSYIVFMKGGKSLSLFTNHAKKEKVLLKKEGEYEVVIPNSIILDKVIE